MLQALADGLLTGSIYALGAIGLTLTMGILRFANFAHAEMMTWGAYMALGVLTLFGLPTAPFGPLTFGWPLLLATVIACALTVALALLIDRLVFSRLRGRVGHLTLVFASFGIALLIRNIVHLIFGGRATYYTTELQIAVPVLPDLRIMPDQIFVLALVVVLVVAVHQFLQRTPLGLSMRAVSENPTLAEVNGVSLARVVRWTWIVGGALAAVAGVLYGVTVQLRPELGFHLLLPLFAAVILGGVGNVVGAVIGGVLIGLIESFSVLVIPPGYKLAVPFLVLLVVLYVRPTGLFGGTSGGALMLGVAVYLVFFLIVVTIYAIMVMGLNLQWGFTGLFNAGVVAFYAIGAYGTAILIGPDRAALIGGFEMPFVVGLLGGMVAAGAAGLIVGLATLRLREEYLAIATFGIAITIQLVALNFDMLTGGANGLIGLPRPYYDLFEVSNAYNLAYLVAVVLIAALVYLALERAVRSPWGRILRAIREDVTAARSLGKNPTLIRLQAFVLGSAIMGLAGGLYVGFIGFVSPIDFLPILTFQIWAMLIVGGSGNNRGAILGVLVVWGIWTASGYFIGQIVPPGYQSQAGSVQAILIGLVIVLTLLFRPRGLIGEEEAVSSHARDRAQQVFNKKPAP